MAAKIVMGNIEIGKSNLVVGNVHIGKQETCKSELRNENIQIDKKKYAN